VQTLLNVIDHAMLEIVGATEQPNTCGSLLDDGLVAGSDRGHQVADQQADDARLFASETPARCSRLWRDSSQLTQFGTPLRTIR
jgi:hypothetical protein